MKMYRYFWMIRAVREFVMYFSVLMGRMGVLKRAGLLCHDLEWLEARHDWPGLKAIGKVIVTREKEGKVITQSRYYLLSTSLSAERFLAVTRAHWAIENSLHWVLDVTMNEDRARNRKQKEPENLAIMRRVALDLARAEKSKGCHARQAQKSQMA